MVTIAFNGSGEVVVVNEKSEVSTTTPPSATLVTDASNPFGIRPVDAGVDSMVGVKVLPVGATISHTTIATLMCPSLEEFRAELGWHQPAPPGTSIKAGLFMRIEKTAIRNYSFMLGGPITTVTIPNNKFLGLVPKLQDEGTTTLDFVPTSVSFVRGKSITSWKLMEERSWGLSAPPPVTRSGALPSSTPDQANCR